MRNEKQVECVYFGLCCKYMDLTKSVYAVCVLCLTRGTLSISKTPEDTGVYDLDGDKRIYIPE